MAGELAPLQSAIPIVASASDRETRFQPASRIQNQRVFRLDTKSQERWTGSTWSIDFPASPVLNVIQYGAVGDGVTNDTAAIQAAITDASVTGGVVLLPGGRTYVAVGLLLRSAHPVVISAYGAQFLIKDASAPLLTIYGSFHEVHGAQIEQVNPTDHGRGIVITNDNTTKNSEFNVLRDLHAYSVYQAFEVSMPIDSTNGGATYRNRLYNVIAENYTQQSTWSGSYGLKIDGVTNGDAAGNDMIVDTCLMKGYEKNVIVQNSARTTFIAHSNDGGSVGVHYDGGGGLAFIGGYFEFNTTIFEIVNTPDGLTILGASLALPMGGTFVTGSLLSGRFINGFDVYGQNIGRIPIMGGDDNTGTGVTRFTGVNEVGFAIGIALDKVIRYLTASGYYALDLTLLPASVDFWLRRTTTGRVLFGDPAGSYMGWDVANNRAIISSGVVVHNAALTVIEKTGAGSPEGVVTGAIGSRYYRTDGGASTTLYIKESGTGNTGWVAK